MTRRWPILFMTALGMAGIPASAENTGPHLTITTREIGLVPRPPGHAGRDIGFSGLMQGRSVWIFGDTFLPAKAADGLQWRSSTWSWTRDLSSENGIDGFEHALDDDGLAVQLLPHTPEEQAFNLAHEGHEDCAAQSQCGSRHTPWPQALVMDPAGQQGVIFYLNMHTGPGGMWDFQSTSSSIATWDDPDLPATRVEPPLFAGEEPRWGAAAIRVHHDLFVYACDDHDGRKPCLLARVPFDQSTQRLSYRFWAGDNTWSSNWRDAISIFDGGASFSVHFNEYLGQYVAFYAPGLGRPFELRLAGQPEGPWSEPHPVGQGLPAEEDWNYALIAHPEFQRESGRVEILSYTHPSGFLTQETRLLEIRFSR